MKSTILSLSLAGIVGLSGCATITRGSTETLVINSDPTGADVLLSSGLRGQTPISFDLPRKTTVVIDITKDGYEPARMVVNPAMGSDGTVALFGNVIFGGVIGVGVDAGTGAIYDLKPNPVFVKLVKKESSKVDNFDITFSGVVKK